MTVKSAIYASNVFHYRHVAEALTQIADEVTVIKRFEISPDLVSRARRLPVPRRAIALLERRAVSPTTAASSAGLGAGQFLPPLMARVHALNRLSVLRRSIDMQSQTVARRVNDQDLFQFMEGLGHRALENGFAGTAVCERRHFHHAVLEGDPGVVGDFPFRFRPDPIGDFLDFEYDRADLICVYSEVARQSFLSRGFPPDKVVVTQLGFPQLDFDDTVETREPHLMAFVGRCDAFKGIDVAVAALHELGPPYRLVVAGHASQEVQTWLLAQRGVEYAGILGREDLARLYRKAHVLMCPSIESFGYAALEGAGHGARLICSEFTGAREFLPADSHVVVPGRDPREWAAEVVGAAHWDPPVGAIRAALDGLSWSRSAQVVAAVLRHVV